jgi:predicted ATPase
VLAIAFTGGPGFGKSTTLTALRARGYPCVQESARAIIQDRVGRGLPKRPTPREFAEQILALDQAQYRHIRASPGLVFFDRCIVDALGMCDEAGLLSTVGLRQVLEDYPFHSIVFVFPPWKDIFTTDLERDQTFEEAVAIDDAVRRWYRRCGFELLDVPPADVDARCSFILDQLRGL